MISLILDNIGYLFLSLFRQFGLSNAGITGMCHHTQVRLVISICLFFFLHFSSLLEIFDSLKISFLLFNFHSYYYYWPFLLFHLSFSCSQKLEPEVISLKTVFIFWINTHSCSFLYLHSCSDSPQILICCVSLLLSMKCYFSF
jgi:hypothetical protein